MPRTSRRRVVLSAPASNASSAAESSKYQLAPTGTVSAAELAGVLRLAMGLPLVQNGPAFDQTPVTVDVEAFTGWCLAGLPVCTVPGETTADPEHQGPWVPSLHNADKAARCFAATLAMERHEGNITHAAAGLKISRMRLRRALKLAGIYQPPAYKIHGGRSESTERHRRRLSVNRAVDVLAKLARGLEETVISTAGGPVRVRLAGGLVRIEIEGETPLYVRELEAMQTLTEVLERLGGPAAKGQGKNGGTDAS